MGNTNEVAMVGIIGNFPPRRCGLATFTADVRDAIANAGMSTQVVAINDRTDGYAYDSRVSYEVAMSDQAAYVRAAEFLNQSGVDVVSLQHEFGIYGGTAGSHVLALVRNLTMPVVTTLHTILERPTVEQSTVLTELLELSQRVVVMSQKGREILMRRYGVAKHRIDVIPHGCPETPVVDSDENKRLLGYASQTLILTFGLLSPDKGIEFAIKAMPGIVKEHPEATYLVLGATHPHIVEARGEEYRDRLKSMARDLGVEQNVVFDDRYVSQEDLIRFLQAADVYLTPYLNPEQITSGTLSYAFGSGKAIVSTPYWHAQELLHDGLGRLVPFRAAASIEDSVNELLSDTKLRHEIEDRAFRESRSTTWSAIGARYATSLRRADGENARELATLVTGPELHVKSSIAGLSLAHLKRMTDDTGMIQHAKFSLPLRAEGYCVDDNARALLFCSKVPEMAGIAELSELYASFLWHALDPSTGNVRNFMGFNRNWLEVVGSEDSHGRTIWGAGAAAASNLSRGTRAIALEALERTAPRVLEFSSPRAWAFSILGLCAVQKSWEYHEQYHEIVSELSDRLWRLHRHQSKRDWNWFEPFLSYDNARLSEALIVAGAALDDPEKIVLGVESLAWLNAKQVDADGRFLPVGSEFVWNYGAPRPIYDQQPVEAWATIDANLAAHAILGEDLWLDTAVSVFRWFHGTNLRSLPLYDSETGGCRDGLHRTGLNANQGAESTLAYLNAHVAIQAAIGSRQLTRSRGMIL